MQRQSSYSLLSRPFFRQKDSQSEAIDQIFVATGRDIDMAYPYSFILYSGFIEA